MSKGLRRSSEWLEEAISTCFERSTLLVAGKPWTTIGVCVLLTLLCSVGWIKFADEDDPQKLLVPQETRAIRDRDFVESRFPDSNAVSQVFLDSKIGNVLTRAALLEVYSLHERIQRIDSEQSTRGYDERSCALVYWGERNCQKEGILAFWDWNRTKLEADNDVLATINAKLGNAGDCCSPWSRTLQLENIAAKVSRDDEGRVTGARALRLAYYLSQSLNRKTRQDPHVFRLERKFDASTRRSDDLPSFERALPLTNAGVADNVDAALEYDRLFVTAAFITISTYAFLALYDRRGGIRSRGRLGLFGTLTVGCAVAAAFGTCFAFNVLFTPISSVAAFLVLGIGLDDSFVIIGADDLSTFDDDAILVARGVHSAETVAARRAAKALAVAGPSITTTSITDFAAFLAGSITLIPAISSFCTFCAVCVIFDFLFQVTLFVAIYAIDIRSKLRRRADKVVALGSNNSDTSEGTPKSTDDKMTTAEEPRQSQEAGYVPQIDNGDMLPKTWFGRVYAKWLLSPLGLCVVFAVTSSLIILGGIGCSRFTMDFEYSWLYAKGLVNNYVPRASDFQKSHFPNTGAGEDASTNFPVYTKRADYFLERDTMYRLIDSYNSLSFVRLDIESNWFVAHEAWAGNVNSSQDYLKSLHKFLDSDEGRAYSEKIVFAEDGEISATQIDAFWSDSTVRRSITNMRDSRRAVKRAAPSLEPIVYSSVFVWLEGLRIITSETIRSLIVACAVVVVVLVLLLGDLAVAAVVSSFVFTICLCTLASIYWWGDHINFLSAFFIIISAGLATDAPAHVAHCYIHAPKTLPTGIQRATFALDQLGGSVFRGTLSTLVGVTVMAGTTTYVFQTFWMYLTTIMLLALWFGLAVAPAVLAVLGPLLVLTPSPPSMSAVQHAEDLPSPGANEETHMQSVDDRDYESSHVQMVGMTDNA